jgi:hypothetical protein
VACLLAVVVVLSLGLVVQGCGGSQPAAPTRTAAATRTPAATPTPAATRPAVAWTESTLVRNLRGRRIRIGDRSVRLDPATLTCTGIGAPARHRAWTSFHCVQPTFPPGSVAGPDAIFTVRPSGRRAFVMTGGRWTSY